MMDASDTHTPALRLWLLAVAAIALGFLATPVLSLMNVGDVLGRSGVIP